MAVAETSREAYATHRNLSKEERIVYEYVKKVEMAGDGSLSSLPNNTDIHEGTGLALSSVTGRRHTLVRKGVLRVAGKKLNHRTGKRVDVLCIVDPNDRNLRMYFGLTAECGV